MTGTNLYTESPMNWPPEDLVKCPSILSPPINILQCAVYHHGVIIPMSTQTAPHYPRYLRLLQGPCVRWVVGGWAGPRMEMPVVTTAVVI